MKNLTWKIFLTTLISSVLMLNFTACEPLVEEEIPERPVEELPETVDFSGTYTGVLNVTYEKGNFEPTELSEHNILLSKNEDKADYTLKISNFSLKGSSIEIDIAGVTITNNGEMSIAKTLEFETDEAMVIGLKTGKIEAGILTFTLEIKDKATDGQQLTSLIEFASKLPVLPVSSSTYTGELIVVDIETIPGRTVDLVKMSDGTYRLKIVNLVLNALSMTLGDIEVQDVSIAEDGTISFKEQEVILMDGVLRAMILDSVEGSAATGNALTLKLEIDAGLGEPIVVSFSGTK